MSRRHLFGALLLAIGAVQMGGMLGLSRRVEDRMAASTARGRLIYWEQTRYQKIEVTEVKRWGRCLYLNGQLQVATADETYYHEALVLPALATHPSPRRVLVIGGGDGGALREVLKSRRVKEAWIVELDPRVPAVSRMFFPGICKTVFDGVDPRVRVIHTDGRLWLKERRLIQPRPPPFDIIICDLPDPTQTPLALLYTTEFYRICADNLSEDGILVTQSVSPLSAFHAFLSIAETLQQVFPVVEQYRETVPSFGDWGFTLASRGPNPARMSADAIRVRLRQDPIPTLHYTPTYHDRYFRFDAEMDLYLERVSGHVNTDDRPVILYHLLYPAEPWDHPTLALWGPASLAAAGLLLPLVLLGLLASRRGRRPGATAGGS